MTATVDGLGRLCVGDVPLTEIADEFRTPAYVLDESDFRTRLQRYRCALPEVEVVYAAKSLLCTGVARWATEGGAGLDVCSAGELATALTAGVDPARIVVHGNAKSVDELRAAAALGVGRIVVDSLMDIAYLSCEARKPQRVLVRVTPDVDIHGHAAVMTGVDDQKFGFTIGDGHAAQAVKRVVDQPLLTLAGLHCHIGSQITDPMMFGEAIRTMIATMADIRARHGIVLPELNIAVDMAFPTSAATPNSTWPSCPT